jgi:hypothetical protein
MFVENNSVAWRGDLPADHLEAIVCDQKADAVSELSVLRILQDINKSFKERDADVG